MRRLALLALLGGCATAPDPVAPPPGFRDATAVIGSQTDVAAGDLDGDWVVRGAFADDGIGFDNSISFSQTGTVLGVTWTEFECGPVDCLGAEFQADYAADGPGRWRRTTPDEAGFLPLAAPADIWIFWIDGDRRTMAMGSPEGTFAVILDRDPTGGGDRIAAAREILDWYGFDVARLVVR